MTPPAGFRFDEQEGVWWNETTRAGPYAVDSSGTAFIITGVATIPLPAVGYARFHGSYYKLSDLSGPYSVA